MVSPFDHILSFPLFFCIFSAYVSIIIVDSILIGLYQRPRILRIPFKLIMLRIVECLLNLMNEFWNTGLIMLTGFLRNVFSLVKFLFASNAGIRYALLLSVLVDVYDLDHIFNLGFSLVQLGILIRIVMTFQSLNNEFILMLIFVKP